jgi:hypothetical protein
VSTVDRALALAAALHGEQALAYLAPAWRARVRSALVRLGGSAEPECRRLLASTLRGREEVHPSWLVPVWAGRGRGPEPRVARWLEIFIEGGLVDMPAGAAPAPAAVRLVDLPLVQGAIVQRAIEDLGLARLAVALQAAPDGAHLRIAAHLGARAYELLDAMTHVAERADVKVAVRELSGLGVGPPLFAAGARHAGPALVLLEPDARRQIAQRLPMPLGQLLIEEVEKAAVDRARAQVVVAAVRVALARALAPSR